ncbi:hypothetical protein BJX76DRAFT_219752 [Aspergillus varians]
MHPHPALSGGILPVCDLCRRRMMKCDRRLPCANCADAGAECQRLRGRTSKKRALPSDLTPEESVADLEQAPRQIPRDRSPATPSHSITGADDSNYHAIQAKNIIQLELDDSRFISRERQAILRSALELVSKIADNGRRQADVLTGDEPPEESIGSFPEGPPRELLFMLLPGPSESIRAQWPDHISDTAYERMATTLLQGDLEPHEQLFHQYCVCVYVKAIIHLYHVSRSTDNTAIKGQLSQSRSVYIAAALNSIQHFNILSRPDLSTIQCMISSALLMQHLGRLNQCWILTSYAAQQITSLNYHRICRIPASTDQDQDIYSAVYWCYYLDRTLGSLLGRPPSLPSLQVSPTDLVPLASSSPYDALFRILLDLAQVQGELHEICSGSNHDSKGIILETCRQLESRMSDIHPKLQSGLNSATRMFYYDWVTVEFCYNAVLVEIFRTRLKSSFSPLVHKLCLLYAQNSVKAFLSLLQHPDDIPGCDDPNTSFLTWSLFIYPLSPFFVVFCNIVGTLNQEDYTRMRHITDCLSRFKPHPHLERLLNLLQSLQRLCEPLFQEQSQSDLAAEGISVPIQAPSVLATTDDDSAVNPNTPGNSSLTASVGGNMVPMDEPGVTSGASASLSADWVMWELFNSHVPAGWISSDFDPFSL